MFDKRTQVIIDALVDQIKKLQLDVLLRDTEIEQLKKERREKEMALNKPIVKVGADNA